MKVLILTCNTGGGHNAAAAALRRELEQMLDYFSDYYGEGADEEYLVPDHFFDSTEGGITI